MTYRLGRGLRLKQQHVRDGTLEDIRLALASLELPTWINKLVGPSINNSLEIIAEETRAPRIAVYGRTGAGKSSVINALLGQQQAATSEVKATTMTPDGYTFSRDGWTLEIVDSRGAGDMEGERAFHESVAHVVRHHLDAIVFVVPALERAYVREDLRFLKALLDTHERHHHERPQVILAVSKIDLVSPAEEWTPPYALSLETAPASPSEKETNIRAVLRERLEAYRDITTTAVPVCADWTPRRDRSYNIHALAQAIYDNLPEPSQAGFAAVVAVQSVKARAANDLAWKIALAAGGCALSPAGLDAFLVGCLILALVSAIARIGRGQTMDAKTPIAFLKKLGVFGPGPLLAMFIPILKLVGIGFAAAAIAAPAVAALVYAIGQAAIHHFIGGATLEEAKEVFQAERKRERIKDRFGAMLSRKGTADVRVAGSEG